MKIKEKEDIQDIQSSEITKRFVVSGHELKVCMQNVNTGIVNGKREILDEILINNLFDQIVKLFKQNCSKYNLMPDEVIIRNALLKKKQPSKISGQVLEDVEKIKNIFDSYEPKFDLKQVALNPKIKDQITTAISAVRYKKQMIEEWGMSEYFVGNRAVILNFYGKPGTGKSMAAEAVAKFLGKKVYHINYSELESKYVGETPKNIRKAFECAEKDDAVLIFDEADSFLGKRLSAVTQSADYGVNITRSVLLMELEKFSGVVIFTTNLIDNYDEAFKRRILLSVYFEMPNAEERELIWKMHLTEKMPIKEEVTVGSLASRYDGVSGADIKDMIFYASLYTLERKIENMGFEVFDYAYEAIKERYRNNDSRQKLHIISKETITEEEYQREIKGE